MKAGIDRTSPLPLYYQLKELLVEEIRDRRLGPGDRVPGDHELCQRFSVSRTVVRQALSELEVEGVIERVKGRGTFVAPPKTTEGLVQSLRGLHEDVAARGGHLHSNVLRLEVVPASDQVARDLELLPRTPVIALERQRLIDGKPWVYVVTHIPYRIAPGLIGEDFRDQSLYRILEDRYHLVITRGRRSVEAAVASDHLARQLGIAHGAPVLVLRSIGFDEWDRSVEAFVAYHRGDSSRFEVDLGRASTGNVTPMTQVAEQSSPDQTS